MSGSLVEVLRNRDVRNLLTGRVISSIGDNLIYIAVMWLVYDLTGSSLLTGVTGVLGRGPRFFQAFIGPIVDRNPLGRLLVWTELLQFMIVMILPVAALLGHLNVYAILLVVPLLQTANLCSYPAQNAALSKITTQSERTRVNSLFSMGVQTVSTVAKAVGGGLIAVLGAMPIFLINAVTFLIGAVLFSRIDLPKERADIVGDGENYVETLRKGYSLVANSIIVYILLGGVIANFLNGASLAVLPMFADSIGGPTTYGLLMAGIGVGTITGSVLASRFERRSLGIVTIFGFLFAGVAWLLAVYSPSVHVTILLFSVAWIPIGVYNVLIQSLLQTGVPDELLGRVTALNGSLSALAAPGGLLVGGTVGDVWSSEIVIASAGVGFLLTGGYWFVVPRLRRFPATRDVEPGAFGLRSSS